MYVPHQCKKKRDELLLLDFPREFEDNTCINKENYEFKGKAGKSCDEWASEKSEERCQKEDKGESVSVFCPIQCNPVCNINNQ